MIKQKTNRVEAIKDVSSNKAATSFIYQESTFKKDGILNGAIFTIKDLFATKNAPTQASSRILENFRPGYNAEVVERIIKNGGDIVAKTHMDELALGGTGTYSAWGDISNPLDNSRIVGGSSSGSAALFTKNIAVAIGSDTGDSVRMPASYVGAVGYKPSYGAISRYGMFSLSSSLDTVGYFTHNVYDAITTSQVLFGEDEKDFSSRNVELPVHEKVKPKKVAYLKMGDVISKEISDKYESFIKQLKDDGVDVFEVDVQEEIKEMISIVYDVISFSEVSSNDANLTGIPFGNRAKSDSWDEVMTNSRSKNLGKMVQRRFALGSFFLLNENQEPIFKQAQKIRRILKNVMYEIYDKCDIFIYPSTSIAPKKEKGKENNWFTSWLAHSNLIGSPSITIPFGLEDKMPFGLSADYKLYEDKKLLSHALYVEDMIGGEHE